MRKCPQCSGDHALWRDCGNGICSRCHTRSKASARAMSQKPELAALVVGGGFAKPETEVCPDCHGTSVCQYCMGLGFVP